MTAEMQETKKNVLSGPSPNARGPICFRLLGDSCSVIVAGIGLVAIAGWLLGLPVLAGLGPGKIPVAPSTAVMFVLYAVTVSLRAHLPLQRWAYRTGLVINAAGALLAALLFVLSLLGLRAEAEHLGFAIVHSAGEIPLGHMSPATAFCFIIASLSFLMSLKPSAEQTWRTSAAWLLACLLLLISGVFVLAYLYGEPLLYGGLFIPPALPTSVAFMFLGASLLDPAGPKFKPLTRQAGPGIAAAYAFVLIFVVLAAGIITAGYLSYKRYEKGFRLQVEQQLSAIADLKVEELSHWRRERLEDASVFYGNRNFHDRVKRYLERPEDAEARERLLTWLRRLQEAYEYDRVCLYDSDGRERLSVTGAPGPSDEKFSRRVAETLRTGEVSFEDFYRNEQDGHVYLSVLVPILDKGHRGSPKGVLAMRINPEQYLYPFIKRWPTPSPSAETLLVRREGDAVLFLNELKFRKDSALNLRYPLTQTELPAVQAALGRKGVIEGRDYRGIAVIADVRPVPDSPWAMVSRMDISEVYHPLKERLWLVAGFVVVLLFGTGAGMGLLWRQQRVFFYRQRYEAAEALREREELLLLTGRMAKIGGWEFDVATLKGTWTDEVARIHDLDPEKEINVALGLSFYKGDSRTKIEDAIKEAIDLDKPYDLELEMITAKGVHKWVRTVGQPVKEGDRVVKVQGIFQDITERKRAEDEILKLNQELEQRVRQRTIQLEAANKELEGFSYSVSHDLRAPLRHITGFAELLLKRAPANLDEKSRHSLVVISEAATQMGRLVDDLLSFSKMGRAEMLQTRINLDNIVREAINTLKPETRGRDIVWDIGQLPEVYGDPVMLKMVVVNLLSNAIKFTRLKTRAKIEIGRIPGKPGEEIFYVKDNGAGFDMKYVDKLFGLFQRLHSVEEFEGTGLGLANVRRIIHRHGGSTWAEGAVNEGATVYFSLPKIKED